VLLVPSLPWTQLITWEKIALLNDKYRYVTLTNLKCKLLIQLSSRDGEETTLKNVVLLYAAIETTWECSQPPWHKVDIIFGTASESWKWQFKLFLTLSTFATTIFLVLFLVYEPKSFLLWDKEKIGYFLLFIFRRSITWMSNFNRGPHFTVWGYGIWSQYVMLHFLIKVTYENNSKPVQWGT